jgi:hypothetical protein
LQNVWHKVVEDEKFWNFRPIARKGNQKLDTINWVFYFSKLAAGSRNRVLSMSWTNDVREAIEEINNYGASWSLGLGIGLGPG